MAIFPFKKEEKNESSEGSGDFLRQSEEEKKSESSQEEISKFPTREEEKAKEILENEDLSKEQPSGVTPSVLVKTDEQKNLAPTAVVRSAIILEVEKILSENLDDLYASLTPEQKIIFKQKGEETASKIELLMKEVKLSVDKILMVIKEWLLLLAQMVPGVNKIFLIKEAKIKTDKILFLRNRDKK